MIVSSDICMIRPMQIAVMLPDDQVHELDRLVPGTFRSRAEAVRVAVDRLLRERRAEALDAAYARGYEAVAATADEVSWAHDTRSRRLWEDLDW